MEQKTGFEPATPTLARSYSTAELLLQMRVKGVEPPRLAALDPKSSASANSATPAIQMVSHRGFEPLTL